MGDTRPADASAAKADSPRNWVRATLDRVPTKWASAIGVGLFLAATAAFGGLNATADPGPAEVGIGDRVLTSNLDVTVEEVFLADRILSGASADAELGERVLGIRLEITNLYEQYRLMRGLPGFTSARIVGGPDKTPDVSRPGESNGGPVTLQPGVTEEIILTWTVDAADYAEGDEVRISLPDPQARRDEYISRDLRWDDSTTAAFVTATLVDLGEGDPW